MVFSDEGELPASDHFGRELSNTGFSNLPATPDIGPCDIDLNDFFGFAIEIIKILEELHKRGITHGNINPYSIGLDGEGHGMMFDLSHCTMLEREDAQTHVLSARQLPFMSPESSGRINRSVDYRSDFYSLGVSFYFLLTGRCPFSANNALDLIYHHIAHVPIAPHDVCSDLPCSLSAIVLKLMAKTAEDRYQTTQGLISDFLTLQSYDSLEALIAYTDFVPGLADEASQFSIPQKLFGRDQEINELLTSFEELKRHGGIHVAIIRGGSGTGKSSLVNEIHRPVLEWKSFFTSGKFDQYKRGVPFFSLLQAAGELVRQLVSQTELELEEWKDEILRVLGNDAAAIFAVLPEVRNLYGHEFSIPELAELGPSEREQRFTSVFLRFILVFAKRESPLVLFLDDIQWSSVVEMNLIANLAIAAAGSSLHSLYLIIAYRDNEVPEGHHALSMLRKLGDANVPIKVLEVKTMPLEAVREMVAVTLRLPEDETNTELDTLVKLICARTEGNAFFITQVLRRFKERDQIYYDFATRRWKFDLAAILQEDLPVTVVDLLLSQIQQLAIRTRTCLHMAACIGTNRFSLKMLAIVSDQKIKSIGRDIWPALQSGLLVPTSTTYKTTAYRIAGLDEPDTDSDPMASDDSSLDETNRTADATFRFLHDRVQQAAYQLVSDSALPKIHLDIGFRLLKYFTAEGTVDTYIFEIVNQINRGLVSLPSEHLETVISLNLNGGKKALQSTAFDVAMQYLEIAKTLAPESWWSDHFDLSLEINLSHVDATYAVHDYSTAVGNLRRISDKVQGDYERAQIMYRMIDAYMGLDDLASAIEVGLQAIELLGVRMPRTGEDAAALMRENKAKLDLTPEQIDAIANMSITKDPKILLLQSLATSVLLPIYLSRAELLQAVCGSIVVLTLEHGVSEAGAYPLIMYALTITHGEPSVKARQQGYHLGLAAVKIVDSTSAHSLTATTPKVLKVFASHICYWNEPPRACLVYFNSAMATGIQTFNVEYTCYAYVESCSYSFWSGEPLTSVIPRMSNYLPLIRKYKQKQSIWYCSVQLQAYVNLMSETKDPAEIDGEHFSLALEFEPLILTDSHPQIFIFYLYQLLVSVYFHRPLEQALDLIQRMDRYAAGSQGTCYVGKYAFLICSTLVVNHPTLSAEHSAMFYESLKRLRFFNDGTPTAFQHAITFIEAEILGHERKDLDALDKYETAYRSSLDSGNVHEAGHIAERTYLWLENKNRNLATKYIYQSYDCFKLAGFKSKTRDMRNKYPDLLTSKALRDHVSELIEPFRSVNMQMNRDGTLSKLTTANNNVQARLHSLVSCSEQDDEEGDHMSGRSRNQSTNRNRNSNNLRIKDMPAMPRSQLSQASDDNTPHDSELTPTNTMSSYLSRPKLGNGRATLSSRPSHESNSASTPTSQARPKIEGSMDFDLDVALKASVMISDVLQVSEVLRRLIEAVLMNAGADYGALLLVDKGNLYLEATGRNDSVEIVPHELLGMSSTIVPSSLVNYVARLRETTVLGSGQEYRTFQARFKKDPYFQEKRLRSIMCMPVQNSIKLIGVLYLENASTAYTFGPRRVELLNFLCSQAAVAIEKARLYSDLGIAKDEAQASNKMKSEFLSTISHEIRTPFNAVLGMSGFLLDTQLSPMQIDYVETIRNSSKELLRVIDDILDFSKMEHGMFQLHKEDFSLRECIEGAMQITAERAASKELELAYFNCHADMPDILINDNTRFRQVVINLLGNSIKFTEKGSVTITSNATILKAATASQLSVYRIQISVRDTGVGIKAEDHKKLFKLFSQIDSSLARVYAGTGLGLAISEKLVRLMNGQIWVESEVGVGSVFHFTVVTEAKEHPVVAHPLCKRLQGLGVLILDDSEVATRSLSESLEWLGMRVLVTKNVNEFRSAISSNQPGSFRVALIDLHYGLADAVVSEFARYDPACKIIRLSRFGFRQKFNETYEYLIKPVKRDRLARVIAESIYPELKDTKAIAPKNDGKFNPIGMATKHPLRILLAEDNLINARVAIQHLKRMGYAAVHAKDGQYCLEEEEKAIYDVILMDVQMPRLDGCQAASALRAKYAASPHRCPRIVAMTANAMRGDMERCLEAGMHAYCQKPYTPDTLAQQLLQTPRRPES